MTSFRFSVFLSQTVNCSCESCCTSLGGKLGPACGCVWLAQLSEVTLYYKTRTFIPCSIDESTGKNISHQLKAKLTSTAEILLTILLKLILSFKVATIKSNYKMEDILNGRGSQRNHIKEKRQHHTRFFCKTSPV